MDIQQKKLTTADEYTNFVREFVTLLDSAISSLEDRTKTKEELHELVGQMPAIISLVNTVCCLRGQDNMFPDRPITENQEEFYRYEDLFEKRLDALSGILMDSDEKDFYKETLERSFVRLRTK